MLPLVVRVVDVEAAALRVVGREGDREQAALAFEGDQAGDVEKRPGRAGGRCAAPGSVPPCSTTKRSRGGRERRSRRRARRSCRSASARPRRLPAWRLVGWLAGPAVVGVPEAPQEESAVSARARVTMPARARRLMPRSYPPELFLPCLPWPISTTSPESVTSVFGVSLVTVTLKVPPGSTPEAVSAFALPPRPASTL